MKIKIYQRPVCDKKTVDNSDWISTGSDWVCPTCYPLYLKLEEKILAYHFKLLEDKFNEIMRLNKEDITRIQRYLDDLEKQT